MNKAFDVTLSNTSRFTTYSLAMTALVKSARMLQKRGADPKAVSFILNGIDQLVQQLQEGAQKLHNRQLVENFLNELKESTKGDD